jgi:hypothetical protein
MPKSGGYRPSERRVRCGSSCSRKRSLHRLTYPTRLFAANFSRVWPSCVKGRASDYRAESWVGYLVWNFSIKPLTFSPGRAAPGTGERFQ